MSLFHLPGKGACGDARSVGRSAEEGTIKGSHVSVARVVERNAAQPISLVRFVLSFVSTRTFKTGLNAKRTIIASQLFVTLTTCAYMACRGLGFQESEMSKEVHRARDLAERQRLEAAEIR